MEKKSVVAIVVMLVIGYFTGSFLTQNGLTHQITALETQVTNLQTNLDANLTKIAEFEVTIADLQTQVTQLQANLNANYPFLQLSSATTLNQRLIFNMDLRFNYDFTPN